MRIHTERVAPGKTRTPRPSQRGAGEGLQPCAHPHPCHSSYKQTPGCVCERSQRMVPAPNTSEPCGWAPPEAGGNTHNQKLLPGTAVADPPGAARPQDGAPAPRGPARRGCAWPWSDSDRLGLPRRTGRREGTAPAQRPRRSALLGNLAWTFPALRSSIPLLPLQPGQQVQDRTSPLLPPSSSCNTCSESKPSTGGLSCISRR